MTTEEFKKLIEKIQKEVKIKESDTIAYEMYFKRAEEYLKLLDLYQKEKEKNKKYQGIENGTTIIFKAKAKYVREDRIEKYYINKNKIRKIIKEKAKTDTYNFKTIEIKDLEELLGE